MSDFYRIYKCEWTIVHTWTTSLVEARPVPQREFQEIIDRYVDLLGRHNVKLEAVSDTIQWTWHHLSARVPLMKGEFKNEEYAANFARKMAWTDIEIVERDSSRDHELRAYTTV